MGRRMRRMERARDGRFVGKAGGDGRTFEGWRNGR